MEYIVKSFSSSADITWDSLERMQIVDCKWSPNPSPRSSASLAFVENDGFYLRMESEETKPMALYKNFNDPVFLDSCLEFFARFDNDSEKYINMEMNSLGTLLSCIGQGGQGREPIIDFTNGKIFEVEPYVSNGKWGVSAHISLSLLSEIYSKDMTGIGVGYGFFANCYKCGDDTERPHYASWSSVLTDTPDFHRPEYFGKIIIK